jgi:hypothetical protein
VIVAVTGLFPVFTAVKDNRFPLPDEPRPIPERLFVQVYVVPGWVPAKIIAVDKLPAHNA